MAEERSNAGRPSGEFMIQDNDHLSGTGQMGGTAKHGDARQPEQSQSGSRQHDSGLQGADQQGGERSQNRSKRS